MLLAASIAVFSGCNGGTDTGGDGSPGEPEPDDGYVGIRLTPGGGTYSLAAGGVLRVPAGAVNQPTEIRVRTLDPSELNRLLYQRNTVARHFDERTIGSTLYSGGETWAFGCGVDVRPTGTSFSVPIRVELPIVPGARLASPMQVRRDDSRDALLVQPGEVAVRPVSDPTSPHPDIPPSTHTAEFELTQTSTHAVVGSRGPEWIDCAGVDPNDPVEWAAACKACGRFTVESGEIDYETDECAVRQLTTRIEYHDCPGSPVEEHTQQILTDACEDVEPIPDILNYRPGKTWEFEFQRTRVQPGSDLAPPGSGACVGERTIDLALNGTLTILPDEDVEGRQPMEGQGSLTFSATLDGCQTPEKYQLQSGSSGPVAVPVEISGWLSWRSYIERPGGSIMLVINSHEATGADHVFTRERFWEIEDGVWGWGPWREVEWPLEYSRIIEVVMSEFVPYSVSRSYTSDEWPWSLEFLIGNLAPPPTEQTIEFSDQFSLDVEQ